MSSLSAAAQAQPETVALFVSDLHLQESMPRTTEAFLDFLQSHARHARQLYLLGDVFEYWAGDDDIETPGNKRIVDALREVSNAGAEVFWIAGNRDFLVGAAFANAAGLSLLPDPFLATLNERHIVLTHGDAQCTDDTAYMAFREQVRAQSWQQTFLAMPLAQRKEIIAGMRKGSRAAQQAKSYEIMDVNAGAIDALFERSGTTLMIHGHTHRPAMHLSEKGGVIRQRYVLPDWDCDVVPVRGGWISINSNGVVTRHAVDGTAL